MIAVLASSSKCILHPLLGLVCSSIRVKQSIPSKCRATDYLCLACRAAKPPDAENVSLGSGALIAQRIAVEVQERLSMMQREGRLPAQETCDLIVFDRYCAKYIQTQLLA